MIAAIRDPTEYMSLHDTYLTGTIPSEVGLWSSLSEWCVGCLLDLCTQFRPYLMRFRFVATLSLSVNALTGTIPSEIELLTRLGELCCCNIVPLLLRSRTTHIF